jgi:Putative esterase
LPRGMRIGTLTVLCAVVFGAGAGHAQFDECQGDLTAPTRDRVACARLRSNLLGDGVTTAFSYYVPSTCSAASPCPVLYLLHGFGGDYRSMLGTEAKPSAWVRSLDSGPPVDPRQVADPWNYSDPDDPRHPWIALAPIRFILIAPHGRTLADGYGPAADLDSFWMDWNPRYASGGDAQSYDTPPPRFEHFLLDELIPYVEASLPTRGGREWRALAGTSLGGYGSYKNGLQHPDVWTSMGSVSGAHNFLFLPLPDPVQATAPVGVQPPAPLPYTPLPGIGGRLPLAPAPLTGFGVALVALGDPASDQAYFRGNMPRDLAMNGRASAGGEAALLIRGFVNDAIPRRPEDLTDPEAQAFEDIVLPMNVAMEEAFAAEHVERHFEIHPGLHSDPYRTPFLRAQIAAQYARVRHPADASGATGAPPPLPAVFDYRTIATDFTIWGWHIRVERQPIEFLNLRGVSCDGLTLQGSGIVTITVPATCSAYHGANPVIVNLGASFPTDEPLGASALPVYGGTATVSLH